MLMPRSTLGLAMLLGLLAIGGLATSPRGRSAAAEPPPATGNLPAAVRYWIVVGDEVWIPVTGPMSRDLYDARRAFAEGNQRAAARSLRAAATRLAAAANHPLSKADADRLRGSARDLRRLATGLVTGAPVHQEDLNAVFVRAYNADERHRSGSAATHSWVADAGEPERFLRRAERNLQNTQPDAAARAIRQAGAYMTLNARRATPRSRQSLLEQVTQLGHLAAGVQAGRVTPAEVQHGFATTDGVIARYHRRKAFQLWGRGSLAVAGYDLEQATRYTEAAQTWLQAPPSRSPNAPAPPAEPNAALNRVRQVAERLIDGKTVTSEELLQAFDTLHDQLQRVATSLQPATG